MAEREPGWVSTKEAVAALGISRRNFTDWKIDPVGKVGRMNYYDLRDIIDADRAHRFSEPVDEEQRRRLTEARIRLTDAQAVCKERENEIASHEIAPFALFTFILAPLGAQIASLLESIPTLLVRQAGIDPLQADKVRATIVPVGNAIANLGDETWIEARFDEFEETQQ